MKALIPALIFVVVAGGLLVWYLRRPRKAKQDNMWDAIDRGEDPTL
jgi:hypothetical protein